MGLKVFDGFKFKTSDFVEIHNYMMNWRKELAELHKESLAEIYATLATGFFDGMTCFPDEYQNSEHDSPYIYAFTKVLDLQETARQKNRVLPFVNFNFEISLFPFEGEVYGLIFTHQDKWKDIFLQKDFIEEYGYFDNTDKPDEFSDEEWDLRSEIWNKIFDESSTPSMLGFSATCTSESQNPSIDDVLKKIPSFESRVNNCADFSLRRYKTQEYKSLLEDSSNVSKSQIEADVRKWTKSDEGNLALSIEIDKMRNLLKPEISSDDLINGIKDSYGIEP